MYYDTLNCLEGSSANNFHISSGSTLPAGSIGELFFKTGASEGLYVHDGTQWNLSGTGGGGGGGTANFTQTYVRGVDFTTSTITVTHNLGKRFNGVHVYDDTGKIVMPDEIIATSTTVTTLELSLAFFGYSDEFTVSIFAGEI